MSDIIDIKTKKILKTREDIVQAVAGDISAEAADAFLDLQVYGFMIFAMTEHGDIIHVPFIEFAKRGIMSGQPEE